MKKINQTELTIEYIAQNAGMENQYGETNFTQKTKKTNFSWDQWDKVRMHLKIPDKKPPMFKERKMHFPASWAHFICFYRKKKKKLYFFDYVT